MAAPTHAIVGTRLDDAEDLTDWDSGNISSDDNPVQGTAAIGKKISNAIDGMHYTNPSTFDLSGADVRHFYAWINALSGIDTKAGGGVRLRVGNDASNFGDHFVSGSEEYSGGWRKFVVSPRRTPDATTGTVDLALIDYFGAGYDVVVSIMGNFNNNLIDAIDLLEALRVTDGDATTPGTFQALRDFDTGTDANQYGVIRSPQAGVFFYQGRLYVGDGATTTLFEDLSGAVVVFEDALVDADFYEVRNHANATLTLGELVSGAAINGATILSAGAEWYLNLVAGTSNLFGCTFGQCRLVDFGSGVTTQSCTFVECGTVTPAGATMTGGAVTNSTDPEAFKLDAPTDADNLQGIAFLGNDRAIQINATGTYSFDGLTFAGNTFDVQNNSGGSVTINVTGGGDTPSVENIGTSTTTVSNPKTHTVTGLDTGSRVTWIRQSDEAELENQLESAGEASYQHDGTTVDVWVQILSEAKKNKLIPVTLGPSDETLPAAQENDPFFSNPA